MCAKKQKDEPDEDIGSQDSEDSEFEQQESNLADEGGESEMEEGEEELEEKGEANKNHTLLYDILNLPQSSTPEEIKKAYKKLALIKHPDKNPNDEEAAGNFQKLQKAYQVLSDPKKRERYDQWGDDGTDTFNSKEWMSAYEYYRSLHPEITKSDYKSYIATFKGSKQEEEDLLNFYKSQKGDIKGLLENIIASTNDDIPRFIEFYEKAIAKGDIEKTQKFEQTKKKIRLLADEKEEAQKEKAKIKIAK